MFVDSTTKFNVVPAGRRTGKTQGAAIASIASTALGEPNLWVDTINGNIDRYYERYFKPLAESTGLGYTWNVQKKLLKVGKGFMDFRSADKPESIEGFGYKKIWLNEAGIILNNDYLYTNAILPMMLDYEESQLYAFGTPKGQKNKKSKKHRFYELWQNVLKGTPGYSGRMLSSYDNPLLSPLNIKLLEDEIRRFDRDAVPQEIGGKFMEDAAGTVFKTKSLQYVSQRELYEIRNRKDAEGVLIGPEAKLCFIDVADEGDDYTCLVYAEVYNDIIYIVDVVLTQAGTEESIPECRAFIQKYKVDECVVETNNMGAMFLKELRHGCDYTAFRGRNSSGNKGTRIRSSAYTIINNFVFIKDSPMDSKYDEYMQFLTSYNKDASVNEYDDCPDATAGLAKFISEFYIHLIQK